MTPLLRFTYVPPSSLDAAAVEQLWAIYHEYWDDTHERFVRSLGSASEVLLFLEGRRLRGMGLVSAYGGELQGRRYRILRTGSVVLDPACRGRNVIQASGVWRLLRERLRHPVVPVFWFFTTFSVRTYRRLSRDFVEYWPRRDRQTPPWETGLLDALCRHHYGDFYDPGRGIVTSRGRRFREGIAHASLDDPDPDVQFFARRNPGAPGGESLPCLARLDARNMTHIVWRMAGRLFRRPTRAARA